MATIVIIAITLVVFVAEWFLPILVYGGAFSPVFLTGYAFAPWTMFTSLLLHSTSLIFHVLLNMFTLWIFGSQLEPLLGRTRFVVLYLVSGLAAAVGVVLIGDSQQFVIGASGALFGLMGAYLVVQRHLGSSVNGLYVLLGINLVIGFLPGSNVAWQAHLGGLVGGALMGLILVRTRNRAQRGLQIGLIAGLSIALFVIGVVVANLRIAAIVG
ncbi:MAG TPA: rhomboid family intramembrane serine protease [Candidatus Lumbricidophila sp.]|nr:rhomboid family intramembrane serine protease [Candidatus Lumbricidophila sp.]